MHLQICSALLAAALTLGMASSPCEAAPQDKQLARHHFTEGKRHFLAGEYTRAVRAFKRAYRHRPHRVILFNIALAYARRGDTLAAASHLRRYLKRAHPTDPPLPAVLRRVRHRVGVLLHVDRASTGARPPTRGWRRFARLHWGYFAATAGATVALFIGAIATSAQAKSIHDDYTADPANTSLRDRGLRTQRITNALWGVTVVSAVSTAVVALCTRWKGRERAQRITAQPTLGPGAAGIRLSWRY